MLRRLLNKLNIFAQFGDMKSVTFKSANTLNSLYYLQMEILKQSILSDIKYADPKRLNKFEQSVFSQTGVDGMVAEIFKRIGSTDKTFVEIGVENGLETNTTFLLWLGWKGCWFDGDSACCEEAQTHFAKQISQGQLKLKQSFITSENVNGLLDEAGVPNEFDLLSLDIDRNTYWVLEAIARRPRVLVVEYNASIPPSVDWTVEYDAQKWWNGTHYFGASLKRYENWGHQNGYRLVGCDIAGFNAIFVRNDLAQSLFVDDATSENLHEPYRSFLAVRTGNYVSVGD